ncbi:MAG: NADPH-dependent F420 reductase [Anaerolineales bacterium]|nr:MAG: NADPH-dependent F420 reductase [Anaerolineales bacterium]
MPKTIAIIGGTGALGAGLALRWAHAGHHVIVGSRTAEKAQAAAAELNAELGRDAISGMENAAAVAAAQLAILTVEQDAHEAALAAVKDALQGKILLDATARLSFPALTPPAAPAAARQAQDLLGEGVRVAAAFQTVPAAGLRKNIAQPLDSDVLVCADDMTAAEAALELVQAAGLNGYYAGKLDNAITVEGLTSILVSMNKHYKSRHGTIKVAGIPKP